MNFLIIYTFQFDDTRFSFNNTQNVQHYTQNNLWSTVSQNLTYFWPVELHQNQANEQQ